jgi:hypothetical protein
MHSCGTFQFQDAIKKGTDNNFNKGKPLLFFVWKRFDSLSLVGHGDTGLSSLLKVSIRLGYDRIRHLLLYLLTELLNY